MTYFISIIFIFNGCLFLLISTVFYPAISQWLINLQQQTQATAPHFWNLSTVLEIFRIIFIIVGIFLLAFGIAFPWLKKTIGF